MKPALKFPAKIKHGDSVSSGSNFIPGVSPETPALLLAKRRGRIPFQEQEKFALFGPALTSVATTRPSGAPLKRPGLHSFVFQEFAVRARILRLTTRFTGLLENPRYAQATPRRSQ
ncbi:unnamed protein product [Pleuronectes platessa]|uniref:Uncharacterized protein n=1 Tax=Pleuronectes platessa TaxID=8262 RepID=A0A9N7VV00_PLEPL|nr:unnamed protein product [Pleuronectes platessa]